MPNNTQLSTEIITHYAVIEKEDKKLPLTKQQAEWLRDILKSESTMKYITIPNPKDPFWEPLWEGRAWWVRIELIKDAWEYKWAYFICDFWHKHFLNEDCNHHITYEMAPMCFQEKIIKQFPNVRYNCDITHSMRMMIIWE